MPHPWLSCGAPGHPQPPPPSVAVTSGLLSAKGHLETGFVQLGFWKYSALLILHIKWSPSGHTWASRCL